MFPDGVRAHVDNRRARWVQLFARLKPGYTVESSRGPVQGLFTQIRQYEMSLPAASTWSAFNRESFMRGRLLLAGAAGGYSGLRNAFDTALVGRMCIVGLRT